MAAKASPPLPPVPLAEEIILYEKDVATKIATITLNRLCVSFLPLRLCVKPI